MTENIKKRIMVTGGLGFVGSNLVRALLADEENYVAIVDNVSPMGRSVSMEAHPRVIVYSHDVGDYHRMRGVFASVRPTTIFHLASFDGVDAAADDPDEAFRTNVAGTWNMVNLAKMMAPRATFVHASTNKVYGSLRSWHAHHLLEKEDCVMMRAGISGNVASPGISNSTYKLDPETIYAITKTQGDMIASSARKNFGVPAVVVRLSTVYGPGQVGSMDHGWVSNLVNAVANGSDPVITGDGKQTRDLLHVRDLVDLLVKFCDAELASEILKFTSVVDVGGGSDNTASVLQVCAHLAQLSGRDLSCTHVKDRDGEQRWYATDVSSYLTRLTGWSPATPWKTGVEECYRRAVEILNAQPRSEP